jgi:hypothetical protein
MPTNLTNVASIAPTIPAVLLTQCHRHENAFGEHVDWCTETAPLPQQQTPRWWSNPLVGTMQTTPQRPNRSLKTRSPGNDQGAADHDQLRRTVQQTQRPAVTSKNEHPRWPQPLSTTFTQKWSPASQLRQWNGGRAKPVTAPYPAPTPPQGQSRRQRGSSRASDTDPMPAASGPMTARCAGRSRQ